MAVAFSSNDETAITKSIETHSETEIENVEACFEIERCVNWIKSNQQIDGLRIIRNFTIDWQQV